MIRRRRPLIRAGMIGGVGYTTYQTSRHAARAASDAHRYETLARLKALLDSGALTQEEFEAEKRRVLSS